MYHTECKFCKTKNDCKHRTACKLYTIVNEEGKDVVTVKRVNVNAKLPVRGTNEAAGYDLSAAQAVVVPAHGKCLVKTGLKMALPTGCYSRNVEENTGISSGSKIREVALQLSH